MIPPKLFVAFLGVVSVTASRLAIPTPPPALAETSSTTSISPQSNSIQKAKREYNIHALDSPWKDLLSLSSPEIARLGQVPGWDQQAIAAPPSKVKREYNTNAPDSPWQSLLPLSTPEISKEVSPGQVPGWDQQAISPSPSKAKREYNINAPDSPWKSLLPLSSPEIIKEVAAGQVPGWSQQAIANAKIKREYDINAPDSPWKDLLPLSTPLIIKVTPPGQVPGWRSQAASPLIPDPEVPPRARAKSKLRRRQLGVLAEHALEPPGRPDFIKDFPEKNNNRPLPPPFDKLKHPVDPKTGKKIEVKKPKYSHSRISLKKRPSLKEVGIQQDGRKIDDQGHNGKDFSQTSLLEDKSRHTLHLQGIPKAYMEMEETMARRQRANAKFTVEEWEARILGGLGKQNKDEDQKFSLLREDAIINRVLDEEDNVGVDGKESWIWRKWSGGKRHGGRKIQLE